MGGRRGAIMINPYFKNYIFCLRQIKELEESIQSDMHEALEDLKIFLEDDRICPPDAVIQIKDNFINIISNDEFDGKRIADIEEFTGSKLVYKDGSSHRFEFKL